MKILSFLILFAVTVNSSWAEWAQVKEIQSLKVENDLLVVTLKDFKNSNSDIPCDTNYFVQPEPEVGTDANNYQAKIAFLLAAYMSNKTVNISYYRCRGQNIELGSVQFN